MDALLWTIVIFVVGFIAGRKIKLPAKIQKYLDKLPF